MRAGGVCVQVGCQRCGEREVLGQTGRIEPGIIIRDRHTLHTQAQPVSNGMSCKSGLDRPSAHEGAHGRTYFRMICNYCQSCTNSVWMWWAGYLRFAPRRQANKFVLCLVMWI